MENITAFDIAGNRVCFCGAELVVKQSRETGYYLECTGGHITRGIERTKKRPPAREVGATPLVSGRQDLKDLFGE